ncbi:hypothetical protein TNCV_500411 [Trichonephila clavipes]|nr:hypothetical protein TNCV_500411 [Trichonephila clavipes]
MIAGAYSQKDGRKRKTMNEVKNKYRILPQKAGRDDVPQKHERSNEAERRRWRGNVGRKTGRPKAVNQFGDNSPQNPE